MPIGASAFAYAALRIAVSGAIGAFIGWLLGAFWPGIVVALAFYLGWQLWHLHRVDNWLRHRSIADPPDAAGLWGNVVAQMVRLHRRKRFHKERLVRVFRELRRSTAAMPDGVVVLNAENEIVWLNRKASELLELNIRSDSGRRIDNFVRRPEFVRYLRGTPDGSSTQPVILPGAANTEQFLAFQLIPYGEGQRLLMVRDVSRQSRLEAVRKDFVANASHELRSPLTVIAGYLETLSQDPGLQSELAGPLAEMRRQAERMTHIIEDLLSLSRLEADDQPIVGEPIDVGGMIAMMRKDVLARPTHPRTVEIRLETDEQLLGDAAMIQSAFANLVDNAAKYTADVGLIELRWWRDAKGAHFSVRDTGPGIAAEHIPRLTERFYRADPGRSRETGGSGLGLAIVKHALERHGAELVVESEEGKGSTFRCDFPPSRLVASERLAAAQ
jgi:two-component system phosphate regulon sensor histidine kinase PhoR